MEVYQDLREFIELLNENKVEYLIVGGYASSFHSRPRFTKDIDIWVNPTKTNAKKVLKALNLFGFTGIGITIEDLTKKGQIIQLGYAPVRIDLLTDLVGLKFKDAYKKSDTGTFGKLKNVRYISAEDLIINKTLSGRKQDLFDVEWIKKYSSKRKK
ncbi:MAG: nucleotidyltransferase [Ignavibacteriae bacterium]|nr:nucleotidyltransferase [Ignavibacteriota bacterium]